MEGLLCFMMCRIVRFLNSESLLNLDLSEDLQYKASEVQELLGTSLLIVRKFFSAQQCIRYYSECEFSTSDDYKDLVVNLYCLTREFAKHYEPELIYYVKDKWETILGSEICRVVDIDNIYAYLIKYTKDIVSLVATNQATGENYGTVSNYV